MTAPAGQSLFRLGKWEMGDDDPGHFLFRPVSTTGWLPASVAYPSLEMIQQTQTRRRGSYGIDAPRGFAFMAVMTVFFLVLAIISGRWQRFVPVTFMVTIVGLYLDATLRGKFVVWAQLLDTLSLRGA